MNENPRAKCQVHLHTNGRVLCNRVQYAFGLCQGHYRQIHENRLFAPLRVRNAAVELVSCTVRIRKPAHDQLLAAALEQGVTPYELHQQLLEAWAERRLQAKARESVIASSRG